MTACTATGRAGGPRGKSSLAIFLVPIRLALGVLIFLAIAGTLPVVAQQLAPDGVPDPTANGVSQQTLLREEPRIEGYIDIPDTRASVLIQPAGRTWDHFHEVTLHWFGAIVIIGKSRLFPKVMFRPVKPSATKDTAVSQCEKRSKSLKRGTLVPDRPAEIRSRPIAR